MAKTNTTTEYFKGAKYVQNVMAVAVANKDRLDDAEFINGFRTAWDKAGSNQIGKYGAYTKKPEITPDEFIEGLKAVLALEKVRVYRGGKRDKDVNLNVRYSVKPYGVNVSGDTWLVRKELYAMGFTWNASTREWWHAFKKAITIPDTIPKAVKVKGKKQAVKKAEPKQQKVEKQEAKAKVRTAGIDKKTGKIKLEKPVTITGKQAEAIKAELEARKAIKKERRDRIKNATRPA